VSDVKQNIKNTSMSAVRSVLGLFSYDQVFHPLLLDISCLFMSSDIPVGHQRS